MARRGGHVDVHMQFADALIARAPALTQQGTEGKCAVLGRAATEVEGEITGEAAKEEHSSDMWRPSVASSSLSAEVGLNWVEDRKGISDDGGGQVEEVDEMEDGGPGPMGEAPALACSDAIHVKDLYVEEGGLMEGQGKFKEQQVGCVAGGAEEATGRTTSNAGKGYSLHQPYYRARHTPIQVRVRRTTSFALACTHHAWTYRTRGG